MDLTDAAITVVRLLIGLLFVGHGAQKLFGWFEGHGLAGTTGFMQKMGFQPAKFWAVMSGLSEFLGGLSLVLGFLTPIGAAMIIGVMTMAITRVHAAQGLWNTGGGYEYPLVLMANAVLFGLSTPSIYSIDHSIDYGISPQLLFVISTVVVLIGVFLAQLSTQRPASQTHTTQSS